jgi:hypothetical protein
MGNDAGALAGTFGEYDQDDKEADEVGASSLGLLQECLECHVELG